MVVFLHRSPQLRIQLHTWQVLFVMMFVVDFVGCVFIAQPESGLNTIIGKDVTDNRTKTSAANYGC